jgi:hypothetical protein
VVENGKVIDMVDKADVQHSLGKLQAYLGV